MLCAAGIHYVPIPRLDLSTASFSAIADSCIKRPRLQSPLFIRDGCGGRILQSLNNYPRYLVESQRDCVLTFALTDPFHSDALQHTIRSSTFGFVPNTTMTRAQVT